MQNQMMLTGDENTPAMPMADAQINHLRRLLAWMRCEYMLDESMQAGFIEGAQLCVQHGFATPERAGQMLQERVEQANRVPAYVGQAHKALTKAIKAREKASGVMDA